MKEETKKILKKIKSVSDFDDYVDFIGTEFKPLLDYITNLQEENKMYAQLKDNIEKNNFGICKNILNWSAEELDEAKRIEQKSLDTINNLQEENERLNENKRHTLNAINRTIEIIKQQPTEDDSWILDRLDGFKYVLTGGDDNGNKF